MKLLAWIAAGLIGYLVVMVIALGAAVGEQAPALSPMVVADVPPLYLQLYVTAARENGIDWAVLAAIGSIETDHGRSRAPGVRSGRNTNGCCAGPMQFSFGTWKTYGRGGDIYDPSDAIPAAARYLVASGAPGDYHRAILAYNHAEWYYRQVVDKAQEYRAAVMTAAPLGDATVEAIQSAADQLDGMGIPYVYGGGHVQPALPNPGLDCSSSVSWVLQHAGIRAPTMDSTALMRWGKPGVGRFITIYASPSHTFMVINGRYWGTSAFGHTAVGTGPHWFDHPPGAGYLMGFVARHPSGL